MTQGGDPPPGRKASPGGTPKPDDSAQGTATPESATKPDQPKLRAQPKATAPPKPAAKAQPGPRPSLVPAPPAWWRTLRANPSIPIRIALGVGLVALIVFVWWYVTHGAPVERIISPSKLPSPSEVLSSVGSLASYLLDSIVATLQRVLLGVGLAAVVGVVLGVLAGTNRGIGSAVAPLVIFLRSIPMGALLPLMVAAFSIGETSKVMFIFFAIVPFVFSDTVKAISIVPDRYVETALTLGASNRQILLKVLVPLALPDIITSLRFQFGLALGYIMLAEAINADRGLGHLLNTNERQGLIEQNYALLFIIAMLAFLIDFTIRFFQRGVFQWRQDL